MASTSSNGATQSIESSQSNSNSQVSGSCVNKDCSQVNVQGNAALITQSNTSTSSNGTDHTSIQTSSTYFGGC